MSYYFIQFTHKESLRRFCQISLELVNFHVNFLLSPKFFITNSNLSLQNYILKPSKFISRKWQQYSYKTAAEKNNFCHLIINLHKMVNLMTISLCKMATNTNESFLFEKMAKKEEIKNKFNNLRKRKEMKLIK